MSLVFRPGPRVMRLALEWRQSCGATARPSSTPKTDGAAAAKSASIPRIPRIPRDRRWPA